MHITTSYGYFFLTKGGSRPTGSTLCVFTIPHFRGFVNRFPPVRRTILQKTAGGRLRHIGLSLVYRKPCRDFELYPSGAPFLSRQEAPRRRRPAESFDRASDRTPPALTGHLQLCILRICRPQAAAGKFFKKRKKGLDKTGCVRYNTEAVSAVPELH